MRSLPEVSRSTTVSGVTVKVHAGDTRLVSESVMRVDLPASASPSTDGTAVMSPTAQRPSGGVSGVAAAVEAARRWLWVGAARGDVTACGGADTGGAVVGALAGAVVAELVGA